MERQQREQGSAVAEIRGGPAHPGIQGAVTFEPAAGGVLVTADVYGLPYETGPCGARIFALHIHAGEACTGEGFADTGGHFNPAGCEHPKHAGDLPPLFGNHGHAYAQVLTDRFTVPDVVGRTVVIHGGVDDFTSQPAGNAGAKIACGMIRPTGEGR